MSIDSLIKGAVGPIVPACKPNRYEGDAAEYCTFNYTELGTLYSDDAPQYVVFLVQVHWFLAHGANPLKRKKQIRDALFAGGFTFPTVENASDEDGQHYVFECEYHQGVCDGEV